MSAAASTNPSAGKSKPRRRKKTQYDEDLGITQEQFCTDVGIPSTEAKRIINLGVLSNFEVTGLVEIRHEYVRFLRTAAAGQISFDAQGGVIDNNVERAKLTREKVKAQVRDNAVASGVLVNIGEMGEKLAAGIHSAKAILRTIPSKLKVEFGLGIEETQMAKHIIDVALIAVVKDWGVEVDDDKYVFQTKDKKRVHQRVGARKDRETTRSQRKVSTRSKGPSGARGKKKTSKKVSSK